MLLFFFFGPLAGRSLFDVPGLQRLREVCEQLGVKLVCHGGLVRRLASLSSADINEPSVRYLDGRTTLFELVPYLADIDLVHSGPSTLNNAVLQSIYAQVPHAEVFRWQLYSASDYSVFHNASLCNGIIPANLMTLSSSSNQGIDDPWNGVSDFSAGLFRYIRNGFYSRSVLYRQGRDLEIFSALLYLRLLLEMQTQVNRVFNEHPGFDAAISVINDSRSTDTYRRLEHYAYLRARLFYLLHGLRASAISGDQLSHLLDASSLRPFLRECMTHTTGNLQQLCSNLANTSDVSTSSTIYVSTSWLGGDTFRLPWGQSFDPRDQSSTEIAFESVCADATNFYGDKLLLGEGQELIWHTPEFLLNAGIASSAYVCVNAGDSVEVRHEFVHLLEQSNEIELKISKYQNEDLTVLTFLRFEGHQHNPKAMFIASPSVVDCSGSLVRFRVNCFGALQEAARLVSQTKLIRNCRVQFFLVALR